MDDNSLAQLLAQTLADRQLSRGERHVLTELLAEQNPDDAKLAQYRAWAFLVARQSLVDPQAQQTLDWLEDVIKAMQKYATTASTPATTSNEVYFSPGDNCPQRIAQLINATRQTLDICVFTITDDRIARPIREAHRRGVAVRICTDNEKLLDPGSDIGLLASEGIPIRVDRTPFHMHHKFALFDQRQVLTGSYNWTRGAAENNHENFLVSNHALLLKEFRQVFEKLWCDLTPL